MGILLFVWALLTWRAVQPPGPIRLPAFEPEGMVVLDGGAIPAPSGFKGADVARFRIDRFEVTEGDFAKFIAANPAETPPYHWRIWGESADASDDTSGHVPPPGT
ncbi:MAG: hypothetical protein HRU14_09935, partial [Planctomycetes bacterium]|nr:hypothetical protein [Planctomycetota bacterium]